ncbi:MAG: acyl-ACP--UDP-N-acetylglucosamine O-acyltransferase, partial [Lentisphaerae bacterium]|nr:acyl-ACP--UDP-N-acetylglucosamine O-acyltransferase [Lentisphaerota bacterium]
MTSIIDRRAAIDEKATLGQNVKVGPFAVIEGDVTLEDDCV